MSHHSVPISYSNDRITFQEDRKVRKEWDNQDEVKSSTQFVPLTTTAPSVPSSWNLCFGWKDYEEKKLSERSLIKVLCESDLGTNESFDDLMRGFENLENDITIGFLDIDWERRPVDPQGTLNRSLKFVSLDQESCYYSSVSKKGGKPVMDICYNACERLSFDVDDQFPNRGPGRVLLNREPFPVNFRYNFQAKKAIYVLGNPPRKTELVVRRFCDLAQECGELVHPFSLHLVIVQSVISIRDADMDYDLKSLLLIEDALLEGSLMATQSLDRFREQTQELHELSRSMVITEHYNDRDTSNLKNLLRDMDRMEKEGAKLSGGWAVDFEGHEILRDGLSCLLDFCADRARRLANRKQRVQNLIGLLYNLTANRDSMASLKIAEESTKIAHETRKDSVAMKTIATLTMLYLPASFVCSVFGTNFFAFDTDGGERSFVVSKLWWIIIVVAVPVTLATYGGWLWWMKRTPSEMEKSPSLKRKGSQEC